MSTTKNAGLVALIRFGLIILALAVCLTAACQRTPGFAGNENASDPNVTLTPVSPSPEPSETHTTALNTTAHLDSVLPSTPISEVLSVEVAPSLTPMPTETPTIMRSLTDTPSPTISATFEGMVIVGVEIRGEGGPQIDQIWELWAFDTATGEKSRLFGAPKRSYFGAIIRSLRDPNVIYVIENKHAYIADQKRTWQLHRIDALTGQVNSVFSSVQPGWAGTLSDSPVDRWLYLWTEDPDDNTVDASSWFVDSETGVFIPGTGHYPNLVWSPNDANLFAHTQGLGSLPIHSVMIRDVRGQTEIVQEIDFGQSDLGEAPRLVWHQQTPTEISMFFDRRLIKFDLTSDQWREMTGSVSTQWRNKYAYSPSSDWLAIGSQGGVQLVRPADIAASRIDLGDHVLQDHALLGWFDDQTIVVETVDGHVLVFAVIERLQLIADIDAGSSEPSSFYGPELIVVAPQG